MSAMTASLGAKRTCCACRRNDANDPTCRHERVEAIAVSLGLDACELDYLAPLLGFISNELGELGGRARKRHSAQVSKPSLKIGVGEARIDLSVKPMHDLRRRVLGRPDAIHHNRLVALHEIANGR